jgi:hypothetical protein
MAQNVSKGTFPIFGYPLVCYSPQNGKKSDFWQVMYSSAMKKVKQGQENEIGQLLTSYDEFNLRQQKIMSEFQKGHSNRSKFKIISSMVELNNPSPRTIAMNKRGAKERPEIIVYN